MQQSLVWLLIFCVFWAGISYYFAFVRPARPSAWKHKAGFVITLFVLAPLIVMTLHQQHGSISRLQETGFQPHPSIQESTGIANGAGSAPVWVFRAGDNADEILDFYRSPESRPGWELRTDSGPMLIFARGQERMTIGASNRRGYTALMFTLSRQRAD